MSIEQDVGGPFPFARKDLEPDSLMRGVHITLNDFYGWRDRNPTSIADHVNRYTRHLESIAKDRGALSAMRRGLFRGSARRAGRQRLARDVTYFGAYNLGEVWDEATLAAIVDTPAASGAHRRLDSIASGLTMASVATLVESLIPELAGTQEVAWLAERLDRLFRILPEPVVSAGGMGKVIRAMVGVLAIGVYDTRDESDDLRREHLARIVPGAYALGAAYVIVDDVLHDLPEGSLSPEEGARCDQVILEALRTGRLPDLADLPDHPLVEEASEIFGALVKSHPFEECRQLYHAAEAMYLAQRRDAERRADEAVPGGLAAMYPDIVVKSGMSRVIANLIGRRTTDTESLSRCVNTIVIGQFKDDLRDRAEDLRANRLTPFTLRPDRAEGNPLYDLFAYEAYVVSTVFADDESVTDALTYFGAVKVAAQVSEDRAEQLIRDYRATSEIARFLRASARLPQGSLARLEPAETRLKDHCAAAFGHRQPTSVDARTFVADWLPRIDAMVRKRYPPSGGTRLERIISYTMTAPGKRLRPALGLMLAEELGVDTGSMEPIVIASELFHTASLILDDLPAQDDATIRRGRPAAHVAYDESGAQLAAVAMISTGFGLLAELGRSFPPDRVAEVIAYVGNVLGPGRLCEGQDMDLRMGAGGTPVTSEDILLMYELKTSTAIEAALVPLMVLVDRPQPEVELIKDYARHAGIVFQIRDDLLDLTSSSQVLGKETGQDAAKVNLVRVHGRREAEELMLSHLDEAVECCHRLPFDTELLRGMVTYFATRTR